MAKPYELQDLEQQTSKALDAVHEVENAFHEADIRDDPPLNLSELQGLDKALQRTRGELTNNLAKLSELDDHITQEKQKLGETGVDEFSRRCIAERLRNLEDE